jgi:putative two-component system response regulator
LIVDDDPRVLDALTYVLEEAGYFVRTAVEPREAFKHAAEDRFDIIFVDYFLGTTQGTALMGEMQKAGADAAFVIMTGNPSLDLAVEALKQGAADFICKPFRVNEMLVSIDHVRRKKELERKQRDFVADLELKVKEKTEELKQTYLSVLVSFSKAVEKKDLGTYGHSVRVSDYSCDIARTLGLPKDQVENIKAASLLHDIGKIGISDAILGKKAPLSKEETTIIRSHPQKGVDIISPLKQFDFLLPAILHHHEWYDGSGYPVGLRGEDIPLSARIISAADAYDAILSDRPYRSAADEGIAVGVLAAGAGKQFDGAVVHAFLDVLKRHKDLK